MLRPIACCDAAFPVAYKSIDAASRSLLVGGNKHADAHIAFHFGAMSLLQIAQQVVADRSGDAVSLALYALNAELDQFMKSQVFAL